MNHDTPGDITTRITRVLARATTLQKVSIEIEDLNQVPLAEDTICEIIEAIDEGFSTEGKHTDSGEACVTYSWSASDGKVLVWLSGDVYEDEGEEQENSAEEKEEV